MDKLLTPQQAADLLQISHQHLYTLLRKGELPSLRINHLRRIPLSKLILWIDQHLEASTPHNLHRLRISRGRMRVMLEQLRKDYADLPRPG